MPTLSEITSSIRGAWQLFVMDARGIHQFNVTSAGFWNSFFAAVILAPIYFFVLLAQYKLNGDVQKLALEQEPTSTTIPELPAMSDFLLVQGLAWVVSWACFPIVMLWATRAFSIHNRYVPFVVAYNWSSVPVMTLQLPPFALYYFGIVDVVGAVAPLLSLLLVMLIYLWYVAYVTLGLPVAACLGFVMLNSVVSIIIQIGASTILTL